jgi:RHS repeat-associated protein
MFKPSSDRTRLNPLHVVIAAIAFCTAVSQPIAAFAQGSLPGSPPVFSTVDENGVNLASGAFNLTMRDVSIGPDGGGGLAFERNWIGTGWRWNHIGTINSSGSTYTVSIGAGAETFTLSSGVYTSDQAMGSTLSVSGSIYTYTLRDGTVALFDTSLANGGMAFDANVARLTQITAPNGARLTYTYKSVTVQSVTAMRLQSVTNNLGYQLHLGYALNNPTLSSQLDQWKTLTTVTAINNAVDYCAPSADTCGLSGWPAATYALSGAYETITDALGRATRITYSSGRISAVRRPTSTGADHLTLSYTSGQVTSVSNGSATWTYVYGSATSPFSVTNTQTDPNGRLRYVSLYLNGLQGSVSQGGIAIEYQYDASNRLSRVTRYNEGNYTQFAYDARGNVTSTTEVAKPGSGLANIVTSFSYPASCTNPVTCNLPTAITDPRGAVTDFTYDSSHGGVLTITAPDPDGGGPLVRPQTRFTYSALFAYYKDASGAIVAAPSAVTLPTQVSACATTSSCANGADETRTTFTYGTSGVANNLVPTQTSSGSGDATLTATSAFTYDNIRNLLTVDGPLAGGDDTTRYRYDAARQVIGVIGPDPDGAGAGKHRALRFTYNADGQTTLVERGTVNSQSDADWANFAALQRQATSYDFIGRATLQTLASGSTTHEAVQFSYDAANRLECTAVRMNPAIFAALPASACTLGTQGANGPDRITRITMNAADLITQVTTGYGTAAPINEWSATYTANGLLANLTDAGGNVATYEYDGFDRPSKVRYPLAAGGGASTTDYQQWTYDAASNVTVARQRDGATLTFTYDALNRATAMTPSTNGAAVSYAYDNFSRLLSATQTGHALSTTYDQLSRPLSATGPLGTVSYQWDLASRRTRVTWPDAFPDAFYAQYDYDLVGAVTAIRENGAVSGAGVLALYAYDDLGRRVSLTRGNGASEAAAFDGASRLVQLTQNLAGTSDDLTIDFTYDAAGGIVSRTLSNAAYAWAAPSPGAVAYADNGLNQYTSVGGAGQSYDARGNLTTGGYGYDIFNRLIAAPGSVSLGYDPSGRLYETSGGGATTRFLYDGAQAIGEYNSSGTLLRRYVPGPGLDDALAWYEGAGTSDRRWFVQDERGSVAAVADASGAALIRNTYDEFGQRGASNLGRFQFTGQMWLPEAGVYHYRARAYSPALGRFLQTDPISHSGGMNLYAYVHNDPINFTDPWGLQDGEVTTGDDVVVTGARLPRTRLQDPNWFWRRLFDDGGDGGREASLGHDYTITNEVCQRELTSQQQADALSRFAFPGQNPSVPVTNNGLNLVRDPTVAFGPPGGWIITTVGADGRSITNATTPIHVFSGTIDRSIYALNGRTYVTTHGTGTSSGWYGPIGGTAVPGSAFDWVNQFHGQQIFNAVDAAMGEYLDGEVPGC